MGRIGKLSLVFLVFLIYVSYVYSLDEVDKIFFQTQQDKLSAQFSNKVDAQTTKIGQDMKSAVEIAKNDIKTSMAEEVKGSLRAVAIGLSGLIVITLAIFKVIDLKISSTKNIKKYENLMHEKTEQLNALVLQATIERNELNNSRQQLVEFQKRLMNWEKEIHTKEEKVNQLVSQYGMQQMYPPQQQQVIPPTTMVYQGNRPQEPPRFPPNYQGQPQVHPTNNPYANDYPSPPQAMAQKKPIWKTILIVGIIVLLLVIVGVFVFKFLIVK